MFNAWAIMAVTASGSLPEGSLPEGFCLGGGGASIALQCLEQMV
jgi:hypothetical protein